MRLNHLLPGTCCLGGFGGTDHVILLSGWPGPLLIRPKFLGSCRGSALLLHVTTNLSGHTSALPSGTSRIQPLFTLFMANTWILPPANPSSALAPQRHSAPLLRDLQGPPPHSQWKPSPWYGLQGRAHATQCPDTPASAPLTPAPSYSSHICPSVLTWTCRLCSRLCALVHSVPTVWSPRSPKIHMAHFTSFVSLLPGPLLERPSPAIPLRTSSSPHPASCHLLSTFLFIVLRAYSPW